ncbi:DNA-directed DNA polymerase [Tanacetum coccineum]
MRRCVAGSETLEILAHCHSGPTGGHHIANVTAKKVYESGFYYSSVFKDANEYVRRCDACQRSGNISSRNKMPQNNIQFNELAELRDGVYENTRIYKERTKKWHDSRLRGDKDFKVCDQVLLCNSRLKMYPGKLKSKWSGPNIVKTVYPHGVIEITDRDGFSFKVNGQRLKKYYEGNIDKEDDEDLAETKSTNWWRYTLKMTYVELYGHSEALINTLFAQQLNLENHSEQHIRGGSSSGDVYPYQAYDRKLSDPETKSA